jgi:hypothetical protein
MKNVAILGAVVNEDAIEENHEKLSKVRFQQFIYKTLEGGLRIA